MHWWRANLSRDVLSDWLTILHWIRMEHGGRVDHLSGTESRGGKDLGRACHVHSRVPIFIMVVLMLRLGMLYSLMRCVDLRNVVTAIL